MKKHYVLIIACLLSFTSIKIKGQDTLKVFANKFVTELNFNPFNGNLNLNNSSGQFKLRRFYDNNRALRIAISVNYLKDNNNAESDYGRDPYESSLRRSSISTTFSLGTERHFEGTRRLSPYIGWEVSLGLKKSKQVEKNNSTKVTVEGAWAVTETYFDGSYHYTMIKYPERGFWSLGANFVTGFDFYMSKGFYLGYEVAFGLDYMNYSNIDITPGTSPLGGYAYPTLDDESWRMGLKLVNGIRIGYVF